MAKVIAQHLVVSQDDGEEIVEIVGHSAGEAADGLHFLRMEKLIFQGDAFGGTFGDASFQFFVDAVDLFFGGAPLGDFARQGEIRPRHLRRDWEVRRAPESSE